MSPSSRGLVPGLFLALAAALGVLAANAHWLLPAQGETGVRYFVSAPALARGDVPTTPWIPSGRTTPEDALTGRGRLMPALMAGLIRQGAKPHVSALWVLAGSAGLAVLALAWVTGGVAGIPGAMAAGLVLLLAPPTMDAVTVLGPDALLAAVAALLLGTMTYRPRASLLHGAVGTLAWLAHPAGVGLLAAAVVWPFRRSGKDPPPFRRLGAPLAAVLPAALVLSGGRRFPLLAIPSLHGWSLAGAEATLAGTLSFLGLGHPGWLGLALGGVLLVVLVVWVFLEAATTPPPPPAVHWSDPAAPDLLARSFRPAAALVALGALVGAWAAWTGEALSAPWFSAACPLAALAGAAVVRSVRRGRGVGRWLPAAVLALWIAASGAASWRHLLHLRETGRGYTSAHWVASPLIRWIDNQSAPYRVVYADQPALILLQTGRPSRQVQAGPEGLDALAAAFDAAPGVVVLTGPALLGADAVARRLGLTVLVDDPHGRILVRRTPDEAP